MDENSYPKKVAWNMSYFSFRSRQLNHTRCIEVRWCYWRRQEGVLNSKNDSTGIGWSNEAHWQYSLNHMCIKLRYRQLKYFLANWEKDFLRICFYFVTLISWIQYAVIRFLIHHLRKYCNRSVIDKNFSVLPASLITSSLAFLLCYVWYLL